MAGPYILGFGAANTGGTPAWALFVRADTYADLTPPAVPVEVKAGTGTYAFSYDWGTAPAGVDSIIYKATLNGVEIDGTITASGVVTVAPRVVVSAVGVPTLATGVLEASGRFFSEFLIDAVKRKARTPISQATLDTWEVLASADEQTRNYLVPLMLSVGEDYMTARSDSTIAAATYTYRPPDRAMKVREIQVLDASGKEIDFPRIAIEELPYRSDGFCVVGNEARLLNPAKWAGYTLRWTYYLRPSRLVLSSEAGIVSSVNRVSGAVTVYTEVSGIVPATTVDLVRGTPPFDVVAQDVPCSVSGTTVTITTAANIPAMWGAAGDLVCLPQQTPAPQIHPDLWNLLAQAVTVDVLDGNGDEAAFQRAAARMKKMDTDARILLTPRVEGAPIPFGGHSPLWDRGWAAR